MIVFGAPFLSANAFLTPFPFWHKALCLLENLLPHDSQQLFDAFLQLGKFDDGQIFGADEAF